jgi:replicative superfamily II helicase
MNAAVMYELAGFQANAVCLSRKFGVDFSEIKEPTVNELTSAFMQRLFLQLRFLAQTAQVEPQTDGITQTRLSNALYLGVCAKAFEQAGYYFLRGDIQSLELAKEYFKMSERAFAEQGYVVEANLIRSARSLLPIMAQRSTWAAFEAAAKSNPRWKRYLKLLARGVGSNILRSPSISELWPSQTLAVANGLLNTDSSKIIRMPTSAGKTRVAELAIVHTLTTIPNAKCVYIAPYRALVSELEQAFLNLFGDLGFQVTSIIGSYETDDFEQLLVSDADIWVMTPEKLDLLNRAKPEFLKNVRLFVLDEAHIVHDEGRGVKFELLLSRLKRRLPNARFLFLSAVVPDETLKDFAAWFTANPEKDIMSSDWRPSHQRLAKFEWRGGTGVLRYSRDDDLPILNEFVPGIIGQQVYEAANKKGKIVKEYFPDYNSKGQIAAELAFKLADLGPVLVFCSQTNHAENVAKALERRLRLALTKESTLPTYFLKGATSRSVRSAEEWLGESHLITELLRNGIAIHHGGLPDTVRKSVETDFRNRHFQILIATNTLAQGVNLPIRTVIIHSCWRFDRTENRQKRIPARDYWNIAGRAGRAGQETEGTIIHIIGQPHDERDFEYYLKRRKDVEPVRSALFQLLEDLVNERISESSLEEILDPEILALLVEEGTEFFSEQNIENVLDNTLVQTQAARIGVTTKPLKRAFAGLAKSIDKHIPDKSLRKVYSSTGLSSESCVKLSSYIRENSGKIADLLRNAGPANLDELATLFLNGCLEISEMKPEQEFGGSYEKLLLSWLQGFSVRQIISEFGAEQMTSLEDLAKFIEDLFEYRLPWGLSALIEVSKKQLCIEDKEVSNYVMYFPAMVKFGVPTPVASWALTEGIPIRKVAIEIASRYLQEHTSVEREGFIRWLGKMNSEQLHFEFGLDGLVLEDVNQALSKAGHNELLRDNSTISEILPYDTDVVGTGYENRFLAASAAKEGDEVSLLREYDNPNDRNAVKVIHNAQTIGYLDRQLAQLAAVDMDCGPKLKGVITHATKGRIPQLRVRISEQP